MFFFSVQAGIYQHIWAQVCSRLFNSGRLFPLSAELVARGKLGTESVFLIGSGFAISIPHLGAISVK